MRAIAVNEISQRMIPTALIKKDAVSADIFIYTNSSLALMLYIGKLLGK